MNLHPIFVHFPIALLTFYSVAELIRTKKLMKTDFWFYFKAILVIVGVIFAIITIQTGEIAAKQLGERTQLLELHKFWANTTTWIFGLIAVIYALVWIDKTEKVKLNYGTIIEKFWRNITKLSILILRKSWIIITLAIIGLISLTITGALGGAIVYGPDIDPAARIIYNLLVKG